MPTADILRATKGIDPYNFPAGTDTGEGALRPNRVAREATEAWRAGGAVITIV